MPIPERLNPSFATARAPVTNLVEEARKRLIVALDVPDAGSAARLVSQLENTCRWFKVGSSCSSQPAGGSGAAVARGHSIFLDLKLHDIPTRGRSVRSAAATGVRMMTLHGAGGPAMLGAARAPRRGRESAGVAAVTVLTSMDRAQLNAIGLERSPSEEVELLTKMGLEAGIRGFVCSPQEVPRCARSPAPRESW